MFLVAKFLLSDHVGLFTLFCNGNHDANGNLLKLRYLADVEDWRSGTGLSCPTSLRFGTVRTCQNMRTPSEYEWTKQWAVDKPTVLAEIVKLLPRFHFTHAPVVP